MLETLSALASDFPLKIVSLVKANIIPRVLGQENKEDDPEHEIQY